MPEIAGRIADAFEARVREHEERSLSPFAVRSYETRGRLQAEDECGVRTPFQRDRDRIVHSKPFRRLKGKTQVFIDPAGDHYRTRMTHTLETTAISRVVARALRLNEDLVEAIGLGHDTGHPPFGHAGEEGLERSETHRPARARPCRELAACGRHRAERRDRRGDAVVALVHVRAGLSRRARARRARTRASCDRADFRPRRGPRGRSRRDHGVHCRHDGPVRAALRRDARLMARIKDTSVDAVKNAADIVVLVEARSRLRKVGGRYTGLCPFHQEKTPSFSVSPDRGTYHCFGCGVGGDAITFIQELEGLDFVGTIEWLADRFNIQLEYEESSPEADAKRRQRDRLHELLEAAAAFYERYLWESAAGEPVRAYLEGR